MVSEEGEKGGRKEIMSFEIPNCIFGSIDGFYASGSEQVRGTISMKRILNG